MRLQPTLATKCNKIPTGVAVTTLLMEVQRSKGVLYQVQRRKLIIAYGPHDNENQKPPERTCPFRATGLHTTYPVVLSWCTTRNLAGFETRHPVVSARTTTAPAGGNRPRLVTSPMLNQPEGALGLQMESTYGGNTQEDWRF